MNLEEVGGLLACLGEGRAGDRKPVGPGWGGVGRRLGRPELSLVLCWVG